MYNGTEPFNFKHFENLSTYPEEPSIGSAVMVIYTVQKYDVTADKKRQYGLPTGLRHALSLNAHAVIVLAPKDLHASFTSTALDATTATHFGVELTDVVLAHKPNVDEELQADDDDEEPLML